MATITIEKLTLGNVDDLGIYCIKNKKAPGYQKKLNWFKNQIQNGLEIRIARDEQGKQLGFIEYLPAEFAWRPITAVNYYFVQCIGIFSKDAKGLGLGSQLLDVCEQDAKAKQLAGICSMSSDGSWIAKKDLFFKNGFELVDQKGRFELVAKSFRTTKTVPQLKDWQAQQQQYKGWHLLYAQQCPWHEKAIVELQQVAKAHNIQLQTKELLTAQEAQNAPSGFGTFSLMYNGKLLADHYISKRRFENILKKL